MTTHSSKSQIPIRFMFDIRFDKSNGVMNNFDALALGTGTGQPHQIIIAARNIDTTSGKKPYNCPHIIIRPPTPSSHPRNTGGSQEDHRRITRETQEET